MEDWQRKPGARASAANFSIFQKKGVDKVVRIANNITYYITAFEL